MHFSKLGHVYEKQDLQWRHVLLDSSGSVFLGGIQSLEKLEGEGSKEEVVYGKLMMLMRVASPRNQCEPSDEEGIMRDALKWLTDCSDEVVSLVDRTEALKRFFLGWKQEAVEQCLEIVLSHKGESNKSKAALWMLWYFKTEQEPKDAPFTSPMKRLGSSPSSPTPPKRGKSQPSS
eukprot:CAMPEP_0116559512 /NCGR_PEP_ID=MMETSP0397-20121206/10440_1 /TAXON_ID=216820 /ORGANISM="Cyclophora tenuis, Strain ECT3854" /LENGTH=175 /DNA_ID=CAMNT_0004085295 /DNA_START=485 /DNA_END=1012 /DNA_ORIENTATION=-